MSRHPKGLARKDASFPSGKGKSMKPLQITGIHACFQIPVVTERLAASCSCALLPAHRLQPQKHGYESIRLSAIADLMASEVPSQISVILASRYRRSTFWPFMVPIPP
jgi:hypothetical protein